MTGHVPLRYRGCLLVRFKSKYAFRFSRFLLLRFNWSSCTRLAEKLVVCINTYSIYARTVRMEWGPSHNLFFKVLLRDINSDLVAAWKDAEVFGEEKYGELVEVSEAAFCAPQLDVLNTSCSSTGRVLSLRHTSMACMYNHVFSTLASSSLAGQPYISRNEFRLRFSLSPRARNIRLARETKQVAIQVYTMKALKCKNPRHNLSNNWIENIFACIR